MRTLWPLAFLLLSVLLVPTVNRGQENAAPLESTNPTAVQLPAWLDGPTGPPQRDAQAVAQIQASIDAMGGTANIEAVQSCLISIQADESAIGHPTGSLTLEVSGTEFRSDFQGPNGVVTLSTGNSTPYRTVNGIPQKVAAHVMRAWFWPALVASEVTAEYRSSDYSLLYKGPTTINGVSVIEVDTISRATRIGRLVTVFRRCHFPTGPR